ncbi:MAG: hypothetical protein RR212_04630 [Bacteroidales bacterium]
MFRSQLQVSNTTLNKSSFSRSEPLNVHCHCSPVRVMAIETDISTCTSLNVILPVQLNVSRSVEVAYEKPTPLSAKECIGCGTWPIPNCFPNRSSRSPIDKTVSGANRPPHVSPPLSENAADKTNGMSAIRHTPPI